MKAEFVVVREEPGYHIGSYSECTDVSTFDDVWSACAEAAKLNETCSEYMYHKVGARIAKS